MKHQIQNGQNAIEITPKPLSSFQESQMTSKVISSVFRTVRTNKQSFQSTEKLFVILPGIFRSLWMYFNCHTTEDEIGEGIDIFAKVVFADPNFRSDHI